MNSVTLKPKRLRFTYTDDICLLKEVLGLNPFLDPTIWEKIRKNLELVTGKSFSVKTLKNHLELLLELFLKKDEVDKIRSGVEEVYCEKDILLGDIAAIAAEFKEHNFESGNKKGKIRSKEQQISELGKIAREKFATKFKDDSTLKQTITEYNSDHTGDHTHHEDHSYCDITEPLTIEIVATSSEATNTGGDSNQNGNCNPQEIVTEVGNSTPSTKSILGPQRSRQRRDPSLKKNALAYLTEKQKKDQEIKLKELELENKKLKLQEKKLFLEEEKLKLETRKFEMDMREREEKLNIEKEKAKLEIDERRMTAQLLKAQQMIIENFLDDYKLKKGD